MRSRCLRWSEPMVQAKQVPSHSQSGVERSVLSTDANPLPESFAHLCGPGARNGACKASWASATVELTSGKPAFEAEVRNAMFSNGPAARKIVIMGSDASGFIEMECGMLKITGPLAYHTHQILKRITFLKELYAASERPETDRIHLLIDNTATASLQQQRQGKCPAGRS